MAVGQSRCCRQTRRVREPASTEYGVLRRVLIRAAAATRRQVIVRLADCSLQVRILDLKFLLPTQRTTTTTSSTSNKSSTREIRSPGTRLGTTTNSPGQACSLSVSLRRWCSVRSTFLVPLSSLTSGVFASLPLAGSFFCRHIYVQPVQHLYVVAYSTASFRPPSRPFPFPSFCN